MNRWDWFNNPIRDRLQWSTILQAFLPGFHRQRILVTGFVFLTGLGMILGFFGLRRTSPGLFMDGFDRMAEPMADINGARLSAQISVNGFWEPVHENELAAPGLEQASSRVTQAALGAGHSGTSGLVCAQNDGAVPTQNLKFFIQVEYLDPGGQYQRLDQVYETLVPETQLMSGQAACYTFRVEFVPIPGAKYRVSAAALVDNLDGWQPGSENCPFSQPCPYGVLVTGEFVLPVGSYQEQASAVIFQPTPLAPIQPAQAVNEVVQIVQPVSLPQSGNQAEDENSPAEDTPTHAIDPSTATPTPTSTQPGREDHDSPGRPGNGQGGGHREDGEPEDREYPNRRGNGGDQEGQGDPDGGRQDGDHRGNGGGQDHEGGHEEDHGQGQGHGRGPG